jgi:hypothetical protein
MRRGVGWVGWGQERGQCRRTYLTAHMSPQQITRHMHTALIMSVSLHPPPPPIRTTQYCYAAPTLTEREYSAMPSIPRLVAPMTCRRVRRGRGPTAQMGPNTLRPTRKPHWGSGPPTGHAVTYRKMSQRMRRDWSRTRASTPTSHAHRVEVTLPHPAAREDRYATTIRAAPTTADTFRRVMYSRPYSSSYLGPRVDRAGVGRGSRYGQAGQKQARQGG